jgi:hypothetical protein
MPDADTNITTALRPAICLSSTKLLDDGNECRRWEHSK